MKINEIHEHVWGNHVLKKEHELYPILQQKGASHICPPQKK